MPQILVSNGQRITVEEDFAKLAQKILKHETIHVNGSILFTKHIVELIPDQLIDKH
jgi:hypothetical protein